MAPPESHIRLQKGNYITWMQSNYAWLIALTRITGGFAPPTPSSIIGIDAGDGESLQMQITRQFAEAETKTIAAANNDALIDELYGILKEIPMGPPACSEDIYGLDTGIAWMSEDLQWTNSDNISGQGKSSVQSSSEEKKKFERAVDIIHEIADIE